MAFVLTGCSYFYTEVADKIATSKSFTVRQDRHIKEIIKFQPTNSDEKVRRTFAFSRIYVTKDLLILILTLILIGWFLRVESSDCKPSTSSYVFKRSFEAENLAKVKSIRPRTKF